MALTAEPAYGKERLMALTADTVYRSVTWL